MIASSFMMHLGHIIPHSFVSGFIRGKFWMPPRSLSVQSELMSYANPKLWRRFGRRTLLSAAIQTSLSSKSCMVVCD
ncbi:hypothetical protein GOP47_0023859 [Adiantum capillus-veneris]|uniref:Uncharacterized protein n=1 Tax=Adiantum capillus-veneris TaxID=13818 RepID=A0A9D4U4A7_ADICA|nr:hypothetical protein GOP47_0023859 [Adiantum capillus-veneris]